jgi:nicotinamidase-related amidase
MFANKKALLLIDIQNDYFPGGLFPLEGMDAAAEQAAGLLTTYREKKLPVVHVRHENPNAGARFFHPGSDGALIHSRLEPRAGEPVVVKNFANAFRATALQEILEEMGAGSLLIAGAMSNMCIDAATRAAADMGYQCAVAHDACAARDLTFGGTTVPASQVHAAFMAALGSGYARVAATADFLQEF